MLVLSLVVRLCFFLLCLPSCWGHVRPRWCHFLNGQVADVHMRGPRVVTSVRHWCAIGFTKIFREVLTKMAPRISQRRQVVSSVFPPCGSCIHVVCVLV